MCYLLKTSVLREQSQHNHTHTLQEQRNYKGPQCGMGSVMLLSARGSNCVWASAEVTILLSPFCPIQPPFHPKSLSKA